MIILCGLWIIFISSNNRPKTARKEDFKNINFKNSLLLLTDMTNFTVFAHNKITKISKNKSSTNIVIPFNYEGEQSYWIKNNDTVILSNINNFSEISLTNGFKKMVTNVPAQSVVALYISNTKKNTAKIILPNKSKFTISQRGRYEDYIENNFEIIISGISANEDDFIKMLEANNGIFFTGADNINISLFDRSNDYYNHNKDIICFDKSFLEIKNTDFIKVEIIDVNGSYGIKVAVLDYNPFNF